MKTKTVVVVGAGASGIAAAGVLNKQGAQLSHLYIVKVYFCQVTINLSSDLLRLQGDRVRGKRSCWWSDMRG